MDLGPTAIGHENLAQLRVEVGVELVGGWVVRNAAIDPQPFRTRDADDLLLGVVPNLDGELHRGLDGSRRDVSQVFASSTSYEEVFRPGQ